MVVEDEHIIMSGRCACHSREPGSEVHCFVTNIHLPWHSNAWVGFYHNSFLVLYLSHKSILLSMSTSRVFSNCKCTLIVAYQGLQLTKTFSPRLLFNGGTIPFVISINIERPQQYIVFSWLLKSTGRDFKLHVQLNQRSTHHPYVIFSVSEAQYFLHTAQMTLQGEINDLMYVIYAFPHSTLMYFKPSAQFSGQCWLCCFSITDSHPAS